jgi:hypothetical protein
METLSVKVVKSTINLQRFRPLNMIPFQCNVAYALKRTDNTNELIVTVTPFVMRLR